MTMVSIVYRKVMYPNACSFHNYIMRKIIPISEYSTIHVKYCLKLKLLFEVSLLWANNFDVLKALNFKWYPLHCLVSR